MKEKRKFYHITKGDIYWTGYLLLLRIIPGIITDTYYKITIAEKKDD